jgi:hypothetical protein
MPTIPPPEEPTTPELVNLLVIEKGHAQEAVSAALDEIAAAFLHLEAVAMACARALDGEASR